MTETILVLQPINDELKDIIRGELPDGFALSTTDNADPAHLATKMADADYVVFWDVGLPAELLNAAPRLKMAHKWGVGVENIDMDVARARGIQVARTTGGNAVPVAEFALALMLAAGRRIVTAHNSMVEGRWAKNEIWRQSVLLSGKTVGIIGMGAIGTEVAKRLPGFGCRILYHNRRPVGAEREAALGVEYRTVAAMLPEVDVLCLTCPLTPETRGMIAAPQLAAMKRGSILVNVARGGIVVEADLVDSAAATWLPPRWTCSSPNRPTPPTRCSTFRTWWSPPTAPPPRSRTPPRASGTGFATSDLWRGASRFPTSTGCHEQARNEPRRTRRTRSP